VQTTFGKRHDVIYMELSHDGLFADAADSVVLFIDYGTVDVLNELFELSRFTIFTRVSVDYPSLLGISLLPSLYGCASNGLGG
jgi:hypothetical protein